MSARLSKHFGRPIRCYEALVTEGRKVTAYFLVDFLEVIIPDEVLYERMFGGYGVPIDGWRAWMGGRDPCRRRLLFFRGRLDPGRFDLGMGC
ncbi:hypothetical protein BJX61DRAFT_518587 [Aspergillus egyptiacus]|nr:hypothetical protein BJX61DRAFT_518587 [Aspergillus egyptiacus]